MKTNQLNELPRLVETQNAESVITLLRRIESKLDQLLEAKPAPVRGYGTTQKAVLEVMKEGEPMPTYSIWAAVNKLETITTPISEPAIASALNNLHKKSEVIRVRHGLYKLAPADSGDDN